MTSRPVVVIGAGNAAFSAALSAREKGAEVIVLERAPKEERGGNTAFVGGALRMICNGVDDIKQLVPNLSPDLIERSTFENFTAENFLDALSEATDYRLDPELADILVRRSAETFRWLGTKGLRFDVMYGRQAHEVDGHFTFFGGQAIETYGGGAEWSRSLFEVGEREGIDIRYNTRAIELLTDDENGVHGVRVREDGQTRDIEASAVVLACGGFQSNTEWRAKYLGQGWDLAKVRGTRFNTGDGLQMALDIGASPAGHWSGAHAVGWDLNAPEFGDRAVGDGFQKHSYTFSIMVNADGERFLDEGANFRNFTYAKYGKVVLEQPRQFAWQVYDSKVTGLLRDEYRIRQVTKVTADSLPELAAKMDGVDAAGFLKTVEEFNAAVPDDTTPFNPNVLDGRATVGLPVKKSNWTQRIDEPPFEAYAITCGITFTFGGLRISPDAEVLSTEGKPIPGLYAAGEIVGGLFYFNYPSGSGLTNGAVFGRIAGANAVEHAAQHAAQPAASR
jgi:tricarballylate dehydrogenase